MGAAVIQPYAFLAFAAGGIAAGVLFSALRAMRHVLKRHKIICAILDFLFWVATTAIFMLCLWLGTGGDLRFFGFLSFGMGAAIGTMGPGALLGRFLEAWMEGVKRFLRKINKRYQKNTQSDA